MAKRWKMVLGALAVALAWAAAAWGDVVIHEPRNALPSLPWVDDSLGRAVFGAGLGVAMVFVAFLPALGALLVAGVRSEKVLHRRAVMDFWLLLVTGGTMLMAAVLFFGDTFFNLARQIPIRIWIAGAGSAVLAAAALIVGRHTKSQAWLVASAAVAASAIVFLACAAVNASPPPQEEPPVRPYHNYDGPMRPYHNYDGPQFNDDVIN